MEGVGRGAKGESNVSFFVFGLVSFFLSGYSLLSASSYLG